MKYSFFSYPCWAIAITLALANVANSHRELHHPGANFILSSSEVLDNWEEDRPPGRTRRVEGTRRGGCERDGQSVPCPPQENLPLLALVPVSQDTFNKFQAEAAKKGNSELTLPEWEQQDDANILSLSGTLEPHPIFWFYIPELPADCKARFDIEELDEQGNPNDNFLKPKEEEPFEMPLSQSGGIVGFRLPEAYPLKFDQPYGWTFSIKCLEESYIDSDVTAAVIRINDANIQQEIETAEGQNNQALFDIAWKKHKIWHETITALAEHRERNYQDVPNDKLTELLEDDRVGFPELKDKPVLGWHRFE
ncbi:MAG TPA: DUF928 domain-containing protein [Oscillatoriaceae cyanobacterium M33_DOE_052]|uniref:DUF928 domain-containing protein n=1 Tax=Planktothricoides sp. SpSt-374 TaxID=2282167 RepID=A0A7C3ZZT6_9CYAN|nr:DUF928 domain-containing protein [Oscillatoriaceae cyanobacterium M33_DOE_052]